MSIQPITRTVNLTGDRSWLASLHGTEQTETITLDISKFTTGTHYVPSTDSSQPLTRFLSGVPVGKITASGLYGPYTTGATDGTQILAGLVYAEALFAPAATKVPAALLWHGVVKTAKLPVALVPSTVTASNTGAQIRFV